MASMVSMTSGEFDQILEYNTVDDLDPSLADGCRTIYDREVFI
jgi:hypothetical protein